MPRRLTANGRGARQPGLPTLDIFSPPRAIRKGLGLGGQGASPVHEAGARPRSHERVPPSAAPCDAAQQPRLDSSGGRHPSHTAPGHSSDDGLYLVREDTEAWGCSVACVCPRGAGTGQSPVSKPRPRAGQNQRLGAGGPTERFSRFLCGPRFPCTPF